jgi:hypothetical protein
MPRRLARRTPWRLAGAAERRLTLRMTRPLPRSVDSLLVMLTRSADRSMLWVTLAGAFALVGGSAAGVRHTVCGRGHAGPA